MEVFQHVRRSSSAFDYVLPKDSWGALHKKSSLLYIDTSVPVLVPETIQFSRRLCLIGITIIWYIRFLCLRTSGKGKVPLVNLKIFAPKTPARFVTHSLNSLASCTVYSRGSHHDGKCIQPAQRKKPFKQ